MAATLNQEPVEARAVEAHVLLTLTIRPPLFIRGASASQTALVPRKFVARVVCASSAPKVDPLYAMP